MKRNKLYAFVIVIIVTMFFVSISVQAQRVSDISYSQVPSKAQKFISKHLSGQVVEHALISRVTGKETYNVVMRGRSEVIFDKSGKWIEFDGHGNSISATPLPRKAQDYLKSANGYMGISRMVKEGNIFKVTSTEGVEYRFDHKGKFLNLVQPENPLINPR